MLFLQKKTKINYNNSLNCRKNFFIENIAFDILFTSTSTSTSISNLFIFSEIATKQKIRVGIEIFVCAEP